VPIGGRIPTINAPRRHAARDEQSAFVRGPNERKLRLVIDRESVTASEPLNVMLGFASLEDVEIISTDANDGLAHLMLDIHEGSGRLGAKVVWPSGRNLSVFAGEYRPCASLVNLAPKPLRKKALDALLLDHAAAALRADGFATTNPLLVGDNRLSFGPLANAVLPEEAVALMGLYLRLRANFVIDAADGWTDSLDRGLFYWGTTRAMLPAAWRWFSACVASAQATKDDAMTLLGQSALVRFDRALRARDRLHEQFMVEQDNNSLDEALFYFDIALLQLVGAFDATARVAHSALKPSGSPRTASWRQGDWRKKLAARDPKLAAIMNDGSAARDALELAALLRNSIHGAALQGVAVRGRKRDRRDPENACLIPDDDRDALLAAARRRGGLDRWGISPYPLGALVMPNRYIEALIPDVARALNRLMAATPVEQLPGVAGAKLMTRTPEERRSVFNRRTRNRLRCLAGL
jgi:hypothetical protein